MSQQIAVRHDPGALPVEDLPGLCTAQFDAAMRALQARNFRLARHHLDHLLRLDPRRARAHEYMAQVCLETSQPDEAVHFARQAVGLAPDDSETYLTLGFALQLTGRTDEAWQRAHDLLAAGTRQPRLALLVGLIATKLPAERAEAVAIIERAIEEGWYKDDRERSSLHLMATRLLDYLGEYDRAFEHARRGNRLHGGAYDPADVERHANDRIQFFNRQNVGALPRATHRCDKPVFIVGMPRSGTTLIEQILAAHPAVHAAGELPWMFDLTERIKGHSSFSARRLPWSLHDASIGDLDQLAASYLTPAIALNPTAQRITDKLPANYLCLGLISLLFPECRVIHCRRHPLDTCLSCYFTDFLVANDFSFDLRWTGHCYRQYERLMEHWKSVLTVPILDVEYEGLVADTESQVRRIIEFVGLPWDERCLRFHENARFAGTASHAQVRQPIYGSSVGRWRHYEKHLAPLRAALGWG